MKSPLKSKTVWFNLIALAAGLVGYAAGSEYLADYQSVLPILVAVQGGLNIVLRFITSEPIV
jgi:hypothetical protein